MQQVPGRSTRRCQRPDTAAHGSANTTRASVELGMWPDFVLGYLVTTVWVTEYAKLIDIKATIWRRSLREVTIIIE